MSDPVLDAPAKKLTQAERRAQSERKILEAAAELIAKNGITATTFEKIAEKSGYSRGMVSQRFGSKDGLIQSLCQALSDGFDEGMADWGLDSMLPEEAVVGFADQYLRALLEAEMNNVYPVLVAESLAAKPELRPVFAAMNERVRVLLREKIEEAQAAKRVPDFIDADSAALSIGATLLGVASQALLNPTTDIERLRKSVTATIRASLQMEG